MRDEPNVRVKVPKYALIRYHKECQFIKTAGRWPWKSESSNECVTTHLPNGLASKMDGTQAHYSYPTFAVKSRLQRVGGRGGREEAAPREREWSCL
jgi:hypothetical protein